MSVSRAVRLRECPLAESWLYVRIHPNFASPPVWSEKMFLCCFPLKAGKKDLTDRPKVLSPPPPPPNTHTHTHPNCSSLLKKWWIWIHEIWTPCATWQQTAKILLTSFGGTEGEGGGGGRLLCLFVKSFLNGCRETTQEHLFTSHRSACKVWVDSAILENFNRNGTNVIAARSHSIVYNCTGFFNRFSH